MLLRSQSAPKRPREFECPVENEHDEQMWFMLQLHCLDISWLLSFGRKQDKKEKAKDDDHILAVA